MQFIIVNMFYFDHTFNMIRRLIVPCRTSLALSGSLLGNFITSRTSSARGCGKITSSDVFVAVKSTEMIDKSVYWPKYDFRKLYLSDNFSYSNLVNPKLSVTSLD